MSWIELTKLWVEIIQGIFTALGILAAGIWSLFVFELGRTFAPNIHFGFICKQEVALQARQGVILTLKIKNTGHTRIKKETCTLMVVAVALLPNATEADHRAFRRMDPTPNEIVAQLPRRFELFADHDAFEPNEEASEDILRELGGSPVFKLKAAELANTVADTKAKEMILGDLAAISNIHSNDKNYRRWAELLNAEVANQLKQIWPCLTTIKREAQA